MTNRVRNISLLLNFRCGDLMKKIVVSALVALVLVGCNYGHNSPDNGNQSTLHSKSAGAVVADIFVVNKDQRFTKINQNFVIAKSAVSNADISVNENDKFQQIDGFGAALTDSSAYLFAGLPEKQRHEVLTELFAKNKSNFSMIRVPLGASDFALNNYTYDDVAHDIQLNHFSIDHDRKYIIPVLQEIKEINPDVQIIATPWSAPWWMKTNESYFGIAHNETGTLRHEMLPVYANYLTKALVAYRESGIEINYLTLQNEPLHAPDNYGGMYMTATQQHEFISYLATAFEHERMQHKTAISTKVLAYDHNWDHQEYPAQVLQNLPAHANSIVAGTAYHCYGGDVSAQTATHDLFPQQKIFMTECSGGDWATNFNDNLIWDMDNLFIGVLNNWGNGSTKWNLALDQNHGPYVGGCTNCRGLLTINTGTNQVNYNEDFYSTASMSKFIQNGATRIGITVKNPNLHATAVSNPDKSLSLIVANDADTESNYTVWWQGRVLSSKIAAKTVNIITWNK